MAAWLFHHSLSSLASSEALSPDLQLVFLEGNATTPDKVIITFDDEDMLSISVYHLRWS